AGIVVRGASGGGGEKGGGYFGAGVVPIGGQPVGLVSPSVQIVPGGGGGGGAGGSGGAGGGTGETVNVGVPVAVITGLPPHLARQRTSEAWGSAWNAAGLGAAAGVGGGAGAGVVGWTLTAPSLLTGNVSGGVTPGGNNVAPMSFTLPLVPPSVVVSTLPTVPTSHGSKTNNVLMLRLTRDDDESGAMGVGKAGVKALMVASPVVEVLDSGMRGVYDRWRVGYADMLYGWGMLEQRAEVLKFVGGGGGGVSAQHSGVDIGIICPTCGTELAPTRKHHYCWRCDRKRTGIRCTICRLLCKGLTNFCLECGHGGCAGHYWEWFGKGGERECPSGCGCVCVLGNGGFGEG
ncbi:GATOR complex protein wdr59, partial [Rhizophlyctis rosea]